MRCSCSVANNCNQIGFFACSHTFHSLRRPFYSHSSGARCPYHNSIPHAGDSINFRESGVPSIGLNTVNFSFSLLSDRHEGSIQAPFFVGHSVCCSIYVHNYWISVSSDASGAASPSPIHSCLLYHQHQTPD